MNLYYLSKKKKTCHNPHLFFPDLRLAVNKVRFLFYFNKFLLLILENASIYLPPPACLSAVL